MGGGVGVDALGQQAREHGPRAVDAREAAAQDPEDEDAYCDVHEDGDEGADERGGGGRVGAVEGLAEGAAGGVVAGGADPGVIILADFLVRGLVEGGGRSVEAPQDGTEAGNGKGRGGRPHTSPRAWSGESRLIVPSAWACRLAAGHSRLGCCVCSRRLGLPPISGTGEAHVGRSGSKFRGCW